MLSPEQQGEVTSGKRDLRIARQCEQRPTASATCLIKHRQTIPADPIPAGIVSRRAEQHSDMLWWWW